MGTWAIPHTTKAAKQLKILFKQPIKRKDAEDVLAHICGDDDLYDFFNEYTPEEDVRWSVHAFVDEVVNNRDRATVTWHKGAIIICTKLVTDFEKQNPL